ncbi:MAG: glycoside hydrolase family protein [Candidatus Omnitrophota bacterium]|jgi:lysozyme
MFENVVENIKRHEGFRTEVYEDSLGFDTIGYGFKISSLDLTPQEAEMILRRKLIELADNVRSQFRWFGQMPEVVQDVILEMCYQLGISGFSDFRQTIGRIALKDFKGAAECMRNSLWYKQTPNRAEELAKKMEAVGE